ncbi:MAG: hypothetical protein Q7S92_05840 [Candidatus Diapherotrites archaeon]|nr:hypothetical protein [Candidatus Diapherotrites archaeon]
MSENYFESFTQETKKEGSSIAENGDVLRFQLEQLEKLHKGDELLACGLILSAVTSLAKTDQLHYYLVGKSGKGKSHLTGNVLKLLHPNRFFRLSSLSAKSLFYANKEISLNGKIICVDEMDGSKDSVALLRSLTGASSQGRATSHWTVDNEKKSMRLEIQGKQVVWLNSVEPLRDDQLLNRFIVGNPDESHFQDKAVYEYQKQRYGFGVESNSDLDFSLAQCVMEEVLSDEYSVVIPFIQQLKFDWISNRRNFPLFCTILKALALIDTNQRPTIGLIVFATKYDFERAKIIWEHSLEHQKTQASSSALELLRTIPTNQLDAVDKQWIADELGWSSSQAYKMATELYEAGLINSVKVDRKYVYWKSISDKSSEFGIRVNWQEFDLEQLKNAFNLSRIDFSGIDLLKWYSQITEDCSEKLKFYQNLQEAALMRRKPKETKQTALNQSSSEKEN